LGNLTKNASEASTPGQDIRLHCGLSGGRAVFSVHNEAVMPESIQRQIFQRSFSTKGEGRGLGTYSVKLFGERYLGGQVSFHSAAGHGTVFLLSLPA
jgi:signal transduction histidine kinase